MRRDWPSCESPQRGRREDFLKLAAHDIDLLLAHRAGEGQRQTGAAGSLRDGEAARREAETLAVEGLEVDGREVGPRRDAAACQLANHAIALGDRFQAYHVNEPAHASGPAGQRREDHALETSQALRVPAGDALTPAEQLVEALDLYHPEGGAELVETVVVTEAAVRQPPVEDVPPLVAQASEERVPGGIVRDDHPALARRDHLVGVEGEDTRVAKASDRAVLVAGADCLAGVLDAGKAEAARDLEARLRACG